MGSVWYATREVHENASDDLETAWREADLLDRVETAEATATEFRTKLARVQTELAITRRWVRELAPWLKTAPSPTDAGEISACGSCSQSRCTCSSLRRLRRDN